MEGWDDIPTNLLDYYIQKIEIIIKGDGVFDQGK